MRIPSGYLFRYPLWYRFTLLGALIIGFPYYSLVIQVTFDVWKDFFAGEYSSLDPLLIVAYINIIFIIPILAFLNAGQDFIIGESGITFRTFWLWRVFVPWREIVGIKEPLFWKSRYFVIVADRITPIHRLYGLRYGRTINPCFLVDWLYNEKDFAKQLLERPRTDNTLHLE